MEPYYKTLEHLVQILVFSGIAGAIAHKLDQLIKEN